ncbi:WD40 repeats protein [Rhizoctonia solani]|uniref:WD40 repeats protein n=1 Tax=Rhizoctonia solani TaxID=456999 RepID=A0A8H7M264_9AGAM|nr:WD40 repeats protein [Rhizoctonia solani]
MAGTSYSYIAPGSHSGSKLAHALPTATTSATVRIGHVQLRDLVHSTGPRGRVAYVTDKSIKEVDVRRGVQVRLASPMLRSCFASRNVLVLILPVLFISTLSLFTSTTASTRTLASLDFQPNCIALSPSGGSLLQVARMPSSNSTIAPPPHPSLARAETAARDMQPSLTSATRPGKGTTMKSLPTKSLTKKRSMSPWNGAWTVARPPGHGASNPGDEQIDGGIYGQGKREPDRTRIVVSNNDEFVRVFDVDTRESASSKEWGSMEIVGSVRLGTPANHVSVSPDGRTMLAVGDDTRLQIFNVNSRSSLVDFERVGSYTSGTEPNFTSAWSASGLQFAAASQDGTVTVWDVRSSSPLASWRIPQRSGYRPHTANAPTQPSTSPSSSPYLGPARPYDSRFAGAYMNTEQFLWDPSTPGPGHGIRSLRFSPAGGNREMLVFTEHTDHVHVIDAQTFSEHQILNVPAAPRDGPASPLRDPVGLPPPPIAATPLAE